MKALPTLRQLAHLSALARTLHFGKAAAAENVTQSSLSASIAELERILGAKIANRTRRRVELTPLGREVARRGGAMLSEAENLVALARASGAPLAGPLALGAIPTIGPWLLPGLLPALSRAYPQLELKLVEGLTGELLAQLAAGALDAAIIALPHAIKGMAHAPLFDDAMMLIVPRSHKLAKRGEIAPAHLHPPEIAAHSLMLLKDGHCLREHGLSACALSPSRTGELAHPFEASSLSAILPMVEAGLGITLAPRMAVDAGLLRGTKLAAVPFSRGTATRQIVLVWRKGNPRSGEFRLLAAALAARR